MTPELKKLLNSLKCPICKSQIDVLSCPGYGCVLEMVHYKIHIKEINNIYEIIEESIVTFDSKFRYVIYQSYFDNKNNKSSQTIGFIDKVDPEHNIISTKHTTFKFNKQMFNFQASDKEQIINKFNMLLILR